MSQLTTHRMKGAVQFGLGFLLGSIAFSSVLGTVWFLSSSKSSGEKGLNNVEPLSIVGSNDQRERVGTSLLFDQSNTLQEIARLTSIFERALAIDNLLESATFDQAMELLHHSENIDGYFLKTSVQDQVIAKLASIDPESTLLAINDLPKDRRARDLEIIFREWSLSDTEAALGHADNVSDEHKLLIFGAIFSALDSLPEKERLEIGNRLEQGSYSGYLLDVAKFQLQLENPEDTLRALVSDDVDDTEQASKIHMAVGSLYQRDGLEAFPRLAELIPHRDIYSESIGQLLIQHTRIDANGAFEQAVNLRDSLDRNAIVQILRFWGRRDPESAFNAVSAIDLSDLKTDLLNEALSAWAINKPSELLEKLDQLSISEDLQVQAQNHALMVLSRVNPAEVARRIPEVTEGRRRVADWLIIYWRDLAPREAFDWVRQSESVEDMRGDLTANIIYGIVEAKPSLAFDLATQLPESEQLGYLESIFDQWYRLDANAAVDAIDKLPTKTNKSRAALQVLVSDRTVESLTNRQKSYVQDFLTETDASSLD